MTIINKKSLNMSGNTKRSNTTAVARLKQDYMRVKNDPVPYIVAEPLHSNILQWHYVVKGPEESPYEGGYYHGKLVFPREFPFKPPSIYMITPSGRFAINTRLCLSISDFHPDTWNPAWSVSTILTGLLSFMLEKSPTLGSIETTDYTKRQLAAQSGLFNLKNTTFCELFPDLVKEIEAKLRRQEEELRQAQAFNSSVNSLSLNRPMTVGHPDDHHGFLNGTITNIVVILGFAAFAYTVKHIVLSILDDS